jgi:transposase
MKRVSAEGMAAARRFDVAAGCDVDSNIVVVSIYDTTKSTIHTREFEQSFDGADRALKWILENNVEITILESTANYHMLFYDVFRKANLNVHIINPILVKALLRVEGKSDKSDAATLAKLAASFTLKTSNMPDAMQRELRLFLRGLQKLARRRTQLTNSVIGMLTSYSIPIFRAGIGVKINSKSGRAFLLGIIEGLTGEENVAQNWKGRKAAERTNVLVQALQNSSNLTYNVRKLLAETYTELVQLDERIMQREAECIELIWDFGLTEQVAWMTTAPAITPLLALRFISEMGANYWERYDSADAFAKAIGVVPANIVSGGKVLKRQTSHGNIHVKIHLLNAVKSWVLHARDEHPLKQFYVNYKARSSYRKAVSAVGKKIVRALYFMGNAGGQPYNVKVRHEELQ